MTPRLPPLTLPLSGTPRTARLILPAPSPEHHITVEQTGPESATLTARSMNGGNPCRIELRLIATHLDEDLRPVPARWRGNGFIDGYDWGIEADEGLRVLRVLDDLVPLLSARTIKDVEAAL